MGLKVAFDLCVLFLCFSLCRNLFISFLLVAEKVFIYTEIKTITKRSFSICYAFYLLVFIFVWVGRIAIITDGLVGSNPTQLTKVRPQDLNGPDVVTQTVEG